MHILTAQVMYLLQRGDVEVLIAVYLASLGCGGAIFWENALVMGVDYELEIRWFRYCARRRQAASDAHPRRRASALREDGVEHYASGFVLCQWAGRDTRELDDETLDVCE